MLRVLACVTQNHEPWLLALAVGICFAGMFTFVRLLRGGLTADDASRQRWVGIAAVAGGGTIWATHFIAMLSNRSGIPSTFNVALTFASVAAAVGLTWAGSYVAVSGRDRRRALLAGGCIFGGGIAGMHYLGMLALAVPGALVFSPGYVAVSVAIGCVFSGAAMWMTALRNGRRDQFGAVLLFVLATAGHHFTSFAGTVIVLDGRPVEGWDPDGPWLAIAVAVAAVTILGFCVGASVLEQNLRLRVAVETRMRELSLQSVRFEAALDNMTQGLCLFDAQDRLIMHNRRFTAMFGPPPAGATGTMLEADMHFGAMFGRPGGGYDDSADGHAHELPNGRIFQVSRRAIPNAGWVATYEDITEQRRAQDELSHMARHDVLTGLPNRAKFREHLETVVLRARLGGPVAVLSLDLDGFKEVNDALGHAVGDELLRAVAARIRNCTRETDLVARLGSDEFAIIQTDAQQPTTAMMLSERLVERLRLPFVVQGHDVVIGTSVGLALAGPRATADTLLRDADIALYSAKAGGRGMWRLFDPEMDAGVQSRRVLERDLRRALGEGQLKVFYQPLVQAKSETLMGFEALLRWAHPERGMISPGDFIPLAEETRLIKTIGAWVLKQACSDAMGWPTNVSVAVNLSPVQFEGGNLVRDVEQALSGSGLAADRLELEITESVLLQDSDNTLRILHGLRNLGVRISLDDFGTGYSSLSYLRRFPFDKIKLDQTFVRDLTTENGDLAIIRAVVGLGQALDMEVLAEGVETAEQLRSLQVEGCDAVQGYLFSRPRPVQELNAIITVLSPPKLSNDCPVPAQASMAQPQVA